MSICKHLGTLENRQTSVCLTWHYCIAVLPSVGSELSDLTGPWSQSTTTYWKDREFQNINGKQWFPLETRRLAQAEIV